MPCHDYYRSYYRTVGQYWEPYLMLPRINEDNYCKTAEESCDDGRTFTACQYGYGWLLLDEGHQYQRQRHDETWDLYLW